MRRLVCGLAVATAISVGLASCGGGGGTAPTPTPTPSPTVTSVGVTGPEAAAKPGDTAQFTATATLSNGSSENISGQATWQSTSNGVATVNTSGLVTAVAPGEAEISALYQSVSG